MSRTEEEEDAVKSNLYSQWWCRIGLLTPDENNFLGHADMTTVKWALTGGMGGYCSDQHYLGAIKSTSSTAIYVDMSRGRIMEER